MRLLKTAAILIFVGSQMFAQVKKPEPPAQQVPFEQSLQAVVVNTPDWNTVQGKAQLFERKSETSKWKAVGPVFPIVIGKNGLGAVRNSLVETIVEARRGNSNVKMEGDGRSPSGLFPLTTTFGTSDVGAKLPFTKLDEFTECVDDTTSRWYNQIVNRMQVGIFDWKSSEKMLEVGPQYDLGVFVAYNSYPAIRGNGSCIFLHIWKDANTGTAGCTAMERENLERIVKWLDPAKNPYLVQMPQAYYQTPYFTQRKLPKLK